MDDFIMLCQTKEECINLKQNVSQFLAQKLHLELNDKSRYYPDKMGVNFCGYRIFPTHKLLRTNSKKKIKRSVKKWNILYNSNNLDFSYTLQSINSWLGHSSHCNSFNLQNKILSSCNFLYTNNSYNYIERQLIEDIENNLQIIWKDNYFIDCFYFK